MKKSIKVFSPVDGTIKPLKDLNDGVFSENMLGEGLYIEPTSNEFYSPIEEGKLVQVFHTKHAFHFETTSGPVILMHIGLDTIHLQGKPFDVKVKEGDQINLNTRIVNVDFSLLDEKNIQKSTPLVLDTNEFKGWSFKTNVKENKVVKKGELIGEFVFENNVEDNSTIAKVHKLLESKNKYEIAAETIYKAVGTKSNYKQVYNCMTRLRFEINDKDLVDEKIIKSVALVKGIIWAGNQIQIVIGGEVYKVKDAVENYSQGISTSKVKQVIVNKSSIGKKIMTAVAAIILPSLPVLMASGLLMGIKTLLVMTNVIVDMKIGAGGPIDMNVDIFSVFINLMAETGLKLLGIFIGYNTMKWLGGPTIMQLLMSLIIAGATLGLGSVPDLTIIDINGFVIKATFYTSSIIPHICIAFIIFYLDKWIKKWMPTSIDVLFRPLLIVIISYAALFFALGPILFLIEQFLALIIGYMSKLPYGIGTMLFVAAWQPLVLTGMHVAVVMPMMVALAQGNFTTILAINIAVFAQVGAAIGVALRTKNGQLRSTVIAAIPGGIVGVTEPILYGVNLPKLRPFLAGIVASAIFGLLSGICAVEARTSGGLGIFGFTGTLMEPRLNWEINNNGVNLAPSAINLFTGAPNSAIGNMVLWLVINIGAIPFAAGISYLMYQERKSEVKAVNSANKALLKYFGKAKSIKLNIAKAELDNEIKKLNSVITQKDLERSKEIEKVFIKINSLESKIDKLGSNIEKGKQNLINKMAKLQGKTNNEEALKNLLDKYSLLENNEVLVKLNNQLIDAKIHNEQKLIEFNLWKEKAYDQMKAIVEKVAKKANNNVIEEVNNLYFNAVNSLEIGYMMMDQKNFYISKKAFIKEGAK
ncbi:PTS glucose transporter subunit IIABC [Spiroplasma diminutum]|uniref:PTS system beta-glucoside IIABC component n=1 Tax=Spiroplasma diminutum CUAS-1 TaxID=1276221 RepID=S5LWU2_9MOLU|nr:PTS glucose transporter subunit IIABC [Spiroplasma diminutum]AGR42244.1 PTS system beta-glucoside IIABC component [Spiroplasma diminutum CUAS-1]